MYLISCEIKGIKKGGISEARNIQNLLLGEMIRRKSLEIIEAFYYNIFRFERA
jgi:hypothetical protein